MDSIKNLMANPFIAGLAAGAAIYWGVEYMKPPLVYKDDKQTLSNDMISPLTLGAAAAIATGWYVNRSSNPFNSSSLLGASAFAQ
jgi:hypothetical protein